LPSLIAARAERQSSVSRSGPAHSYDAQMEVTLGIWVNEGLIGVRRNQQRRDYVDGLLLLAGATVFGDAAATITAATMLAPALARIGSV
jgi:hypothetical protein